MRDCPVFLVLAMNTQVEEVVHRGKFLETSLAAKPKHGSFASSKRQMRTLGAIVQPVPGFLSRGIADLFQRGTIAFGNFL